MTQPSMLDSAPNLDHLKPLTQRVAGLFVSRPGVWISMHELARVGGTGGWRTRVSEARDALGTIDNRQREQDGYRVSEYRWVP